MTDSSNTPTPIFPPLTSHHVLACQFSSWYPIFSAVSVKGTVIRPLPTQFRTFLESDGITIPLGADDSPDGPSRLDSGSDTNSDRDGESDDSDNATQQFAFPELDTRMREIMKLYDNAVFPKLNWTSPQDAAWILNPGSPLKCTSPADVYMYLKASDFALHDLDRDAVFSACQDRTEDENIQSYELELVLKKWYPIQRSREMRCFVRDGNLVAICQRDNNYYEFLNRTETQRTIQEGLYSFWNEKIRGKFNGGPYYVFDMVLTRALSGGHIIDFNPYAEQTDSLLYTYEELASIHCIQGLPDMRVITSGAHPAASRNAPKYQHNMVPVEALHLSQGRGIDEFNESWIEEIKRASRE